MTAPTRSGRARVYLPGLPVDSPGALGKGALAGLIHGRRLAAQNSVRAPRRVHKRWVLTRVGADCREAVVAFARGADDISPVSRSEPRRMIRVSLAVLQMKVRRRSEQGFGSRFPAATAAAGSRNQTKDDPRDAVPQIVPPEEFHEGTGPSIHE